MHGSLTGAASCLFTLPSLLTQYHCSSRWQEFYLFRHPLQLTVVMTPFWIIKFRKTSEISGIFLLSIFRCAPSSAIYFFAGMQKWWLALEKPHCDHVRKTGQCPELTLPIAYLFLMHEKNKVLIQLSYSLNFLLVVDKCESYFTQKWWGMINIYWIV